MQKSMMTMLGLSDAGDRSWIQTRWWQLCTRAISEQHWTSRIPSPCPKGTRSGRRQANLLLTPHVGGTMSGARARIYKGVRAQILQWARGEQLQNVIDVEHH